jgi:hypothetical protein
VVVTELLPLGALVGLPDALLLLLWVEETDAETLLLLLDADALGALPTEAVAVGVTEGMHSGGTLPMSAPAPRSRATKPWDPAWPLKPPSPGSGPTRAAS